ncbi:unnamed protein product [Effrenium voratum]|uniref:Uncharacterized protein n=1 Tax=Effrenium voratum TaxID=2562239 RepID=A0AA36JCY1_9DINO|nr:unnamed protein product [Effrenium voratum]
MGKGAGQSSRRSAKQAQGYLSEGVRMYQAGRSRFQSKVLLRAKELLAYSVALSPSPAGFFYLGNTLNLLSRPKSAARAYLECLRLDPTSAAAHQNVAQVFDDLGNWTAAHAHYHHWALLEPRSAKAKKALALSYLWAHSERLQEGSQLCNEAAELEPDPSIPFDCAQLLVLLLPPSAEAELMDPGQSPWELADPSSSHWMAHIEPKFRRAQETAFRSWRGGPRPLPWNGQAAALWSDTPTLCRNGGLVVRDPQLMADGGEASLELSSGGAVYGQRVPPTFGGPFTWAGQRYLERSVRLSRVNDVMISGNEGVITKGCQILVPYYDKQVPWHENLPHRATPEGVLWLPVALWLLVMFPANFFSFLVDELARLAVWLTVSKQRIPLLVPADRGTLKSFMYDWFTLLGGFEVIPYDVRPHFMGAARVAEPRFLVRELHIVDWFDAPSASRREDVFLLPPRWALQQLFHHLLLVFWARFFQGMKAPQPGIPCAQGGSWQLAKRGWQRPAKAQSACCGFRGRQRRPGVLPTKRHCWAPSCPIWAQAGNWRPSLTCRPRPVLMRPYVFSAQLTWSWDCMGPGKRTSCFADPAPALWTSICQSRTRSTQPTTAMHSASCIAW